MGTKVYFSDFFLIPPELLDEYGALNVSLINDLPLFVDPFLLFNSKKPEYQQLHASIIQYIRFLREISENKGIHPGLLENFFQFPEIRQNWLGYSRVGNRGSGLGKNFAISLNQNLFAIFSNFGQEDITKSSHLEKLCLIKDGVGKDNISDFTTNLIKSFLLDYTQKFAVNHLNPNLRRKIAIKKVLFNYQTMSWESRIYDLPYIKKDYVILTPRDILTKDDTWINRQDMVGEFDDIVTGLPNDQLRGLLNSFLLHNMPANPKSDDRSKVISSLIQKYPEFIDYYIRYKEDNGDKAKDISQGKVEETEKWFIHNVNSLIRILHKDNVFYKTSDKTYQESFNRVLFLKDVIENKDGYKIFYDGNIPLRREVDLQLIFRLTWFASISDVNREVDNGRGPVDYKISNGSKDSTLVEFKLASNSQLKRNLEKQVEVYEKASNPTNPSIKVIMYFSESELSKVTSILNDLNLQDNRNIILIDARKDNKTSASKT